MPAPRSAIVTVGTEITAGLRLDTNTREIALALLAAGYETVETVSLPDDRDSVASALERLVALCDLVIVTGGLGPTHDDITSEAAAQALGVCLVEDASTRKRLDAWVARMHLVPTREQVFRQALVMEGARVIEPTKGTAPGQIARSATGATLVLLPGPPHEMRSMLASAIPGLPDAPAAPRELACTGTTESDAQLKAQAALGDRPGIVLGLLAAPGDVHVVLFDDGAGQAGLDDAARNVREALGDACYSDDGSTLAEAVFKLAHETGTRLATAESCTGGLVGAALTTVPGSSAVFLGGVVAYANEAKTALLGVPAGLLAEYGAVSEETARAMAEGARDRLGADLAVSVTGIAGPDGGTPEKPVGTVWFGMADAQGSHAEMRLLMGDRDGVRQRATIVALDLLRRKMGERR